eukprot:350944-Pleurochrysis_carterae.AAC.2
MSRTEPLGVPMMASYPCVDDDPGVEAWLDLDERNHERVFRDLNRWGFKTDNEQHANWAAPGRWHSAYHNSSSIALGTH